MKRIQLLLAIVVLSTNAFGSDGALKGEFSVSATQKVHFSKGNLQYKASTEIWRFAGKQYDIIGKANKNISATYTGWIDLFGWATSGYCASKCMYPYKTGGNSSEYGPNGNIDDTNYDWGVYNKISNGGNIKNIWRTLTSTEWDYIFLRRTNAKKLFGMGTVNGIQGVILLPDNWKKPSGITFSPSTSNGLSYTGGTYSHDYTNSNDDNFTHNAYTIEQWSIMEGNGAVFLPAAGYRDANYSSGSGQYWTASDGLSGGYGVVVMWFDSKYWDCDYETHDDLTPYFWRYQGRAVRLVQNSSVYESTTYTITWNNSDGSTITTSSVGLGATPAYEGETPTKPATAQYTYSFKGWEPAVVAVTGNATYTAQYDSVVNNYTIVFNNYNGAELQSSSVAYGLTPEYNGATPTKPATAQYTYSFKGWEPAVVAVTGNATYTAQYDSVVNNYTITFSNYNGTQLQSGSVAYGQTPVYDGVTPTKPATAQYTYSFNGWDPEIVAVTGNATYTAQFDSTLIEYEIDTNPGSEPIEGGSVHVNGTPNYGETITLTPIEEDGYVFVEWSDGNTDNPRDITVEGNIAIYPIFHKCEEIIFNIAQTIYKGSSYSFGGKELTVKGLYYDTIPLANGCDSVVELKLSVVKAPNFTLRVVVNDETMGTVTGTGSYKAGTSVTITATPASSKYIFVRWYNEDENIDVYENPYTFTLNRNLQLRAVFRKAPRKAPKSTSQTK